MFRVAIPVVGVSSSRAAEEFYCGRLGFRRKHAYRPGPDPLDPCWMVVIRDDVRLILSSFDGDRSRRANVQIYVENAAALRREYIEAGVPSVGELWDQSWGNIEFGIRDPDGNNLNFAQEKGG